jgi:hypothetical protein
VGGREGGRLDRMGARGEGGRQGRRARVLACRGCRDREQAGTKRGGKKLGTSKEHPRNMLATSLQLWGWSGGAMVLVGRGVRGRGK